MAEAKNQCAHMDKKKDKMRKMKRTDYISWDEYFMGIALLSAGRSKDPNTQVGACIVNESNRIVSTGYNGFPVNCSDDEYPWEREGKNLETKYPYVVHAEMNAILNTRNENLDNTRIYVTLFPCNECAKAIIQSGIKEVIYYQNKYDGSDSVEAAKKMFTSAGVKYKKYIETGRIYQINI
jgi:dCMP deaminase